MSHRSRKLRAERSRRTTTATWRRTTTATWRRTTTAMCRTTTATFRSSSTWRWCDSSTAPSPLTPSWRAARRAGAASAAAGGRRRRRSSTTGRRRRPGAAACGPSRGSCELGWKQTEEGGRCIEFISQIIWWQQSLPRCLLCFHILLIFWSWSTRRTFQVAYRKLIK